MRRLTLILSDLNLPVVPDQHALPEALPLASFDWLLQSAHTVRRADEWQRWLAREAGRADLAAMSKAHACARGLGLAPAGTWMATPVHLEARLDHVRLSNRGLLRMSSAQRDTLRAEFARTFGPLLALHDTGERGLLLSGGPQGRIATLDPAALLDFDIGTFLPLPIRAVGKELRRLGTEIEMWLNTCETNLMRERAGERRISALWLWGGGDHELPPSPPRAGVEFALYGSHPYLRAVREVVPEPPAGFEALRETGDVFVELTPMSGAPTETLATIENAWLAPARAALSAGRLEAVTLVVNDLVFRVDRRLRWGFWRRRRNWLQLLLHAAQHVPPVA